MMFNVGLMNDANAALLRAATTKMRTIIRSLIRPPNNTLNISSISKPQLSMRSNRTVAPRALVSTAVPPSLSVTDSTDGQHGQHVISQSTERADRWGQIFSASTPVDGTFSATGVGNRSTAREPHDTDLPDATRRHRHSVRNLEDTPRTAQYDLIARSGHPSRRIQSEEEEGGYNPYVRKDSGAQIIKHKSSRREGRRGSRERDALRR